MEIKHTTPPMIGPILKDALLCCVSEGLKVEIGENTIVANDEVDMVVDASSGSKLK